MEQEDPRSRLSKPNKTPQVNKKPNPLTQPIGQPLVIAHNKRIQNLRYNDLHKFLKTAHRIDHLQPLQLRSVELYAMDLALPG